MPQEWYYSIYDISIHAPPRGATLHPQRAECVRCISIHAPPRGATRGATFWHTKTKFQFTPLREGRRKMRPTILRNFYFNSRPSARGDLFHRVIPSCVLHFNSRPSARGDLRNGRYTAATVVISIHAPPRGATAKDMQFLQIFCSTLTNQHGLTIVPRNLSRLFW